MKKKLFAEIIGWYGTFAIVLAYALVSFSVLKGNGTVFQLLNFTGAIGLIVICLLKKVYQSAVLNIIWTIIALVALLKIIL